ncbi:MAG: hypothetical protein ACMUIP_07835 [bacterium]
MGKKVGLWIDYDKAIIVSIDADDEDIAIIRSNADGEGLFSENMSEWRQRQLHKYYREIIFEINDAEKILIFGPDEAKDELEKQMKQSYSLSRKIAAVETADTMTEDQIRVKVREFNKLLMSHA